MRFYIYCAVSAVLTTLVVLLPLMNRPNFFSAAIVVSQNSACMLILANMGLIISLLVGKLVQRIFFGELHVVETERLYESAWYAVTESVLILPLFKDESKLEFVVFFGLLLFLRIFHWICADRIDLIFQTGRHISILNHARLSLAIIALASADLYLVRYWVMAFRISSNSEHNSVMIPTFSFECLLLFNSIFSTAGKYILNIIEAVYLHRHDDEDIWDRKNLYIFYLDVVSKVTRLLAYSALFFFILLPHHLLPLHIIRDCYVTLMSLISTINTHLQSRKAKRQIETVVRTATAEDLIDSDDVCIICREEMTIEEDQALRTLPKKLLCGHIIHQGCLMSWLERSLRCPTCRRSVMDGRLPDQPRGAAAPPVQNPVAAAGGLINQHANPAEQQNGPAENFGLNQPFPHPMVDNTQEPNAGNNTIPTQPAAHYSQQEIKVGTSMMMLRNHVEIPDGFQLPEEWAIVEAYETLEGTLKIQLNDGIWASSSPKSIETSKPTSHIRSSNASQSITLSNEHSTGEHGLDQTLGTQPQTHFDSHAEKLNALPTFRDKGKGVQSSQLESETSQSSHTLDSLSEPFVNVHSASSIQEPAIETKESIPVVSDNSPEPLSFQNKIQDENNGKTTGFEQKESLPSSSAQTLSTSAFESNSSKQENEELEQ